MPKTLMCARFCLYGDDVDKSVMLETLIKMAAAGKREIVARAEQSGSEGCYVEVAIYNEVAKQWQRYAFLKCDERYEDAPALDDQGDRNVAIYIAHKINESADQFTGVFHKLPDYDRPTPYWVIKSNAETDPDTGETLYWCNGNGWVVMMDAARYDNDLKSRIAHLPAESEWEYVDNG